MEVQKETVCEDTLYIIREYYHLNTGPLFDVLASDCVWLGIEISRFGCGSDQGAVSKRLYYAAL